MKKLNIKGYSLVELLATITILGILSGVAIVAYSRYKETAKIKVCDTLADAAMAAMEDYIMDNPGAEQATINALYYDQYLERPADASNYSQECVGTVQAKLIPSAPADKKLDVYDYTVNLCCSAHQFQYLFNHDSVKPSKVDLDDDTCQNIQEMTETEKANQKAAEEAAAGGETEPEESEPIEP